MKSKEIRRIIWAIDPFEDSDEIQRNIVLTLQTISKACASDNGPEIEPLYALSPDQVNFPRDYAAHFIETYKPTAQKALEQKLSQFSDLPKLLPPRVLLHQRFSLRSLVQHFTHYAESTATDLIVVGTHGRKGLSRLLLGSFAESLLLQSKIPILVVGTHSQEKMNFERILFASDLEGQPTETSFPHLLKIAKQMKSEITLLHAIPRPFGPAFQSGVYLFSGAWATIPNFLEEEGKKQLERAQLWKNEAKKEKVELRTVVDVDTSGIVSSILRQAEQLQSGLIVMEAKSGPIASTIVGSLTRQVIRQAPCPVWVMRSKDSL